MRLRNPDPLARRFHLAVAWRWWATVLAMPALVPYLVARGFELTDVGLVFATFAASTALLEVPTGGLADALGRVRTTLAADVLGWLGRLGFLLAPDLPSVLVAAAVAGSARALASGALEAWYVDARRRRDPTHDLQAPLARVGVVTSLAVGSGTLVGGFLPLAGPVLGFGPANEASALALAFWTSLVVGSVALAFTARLRDVEAGPVAGRSAARVDRVLRGTWTALRNDGRLAALTALGAASGAAIMAFETLYPVELAARWHGAVTAPLGVAFAGAFVATAFGQHMGGRARRAATASTAALGFGVAALAVAVLALVPGEGAWGLAIAVLAFWATYGALAYPGPALGAAFHRRAPSERRAALLSAQSLAGYVGGFASSLVAGTVAQAFGTSAVWAAVAAGAAVTAATLAVAARAWRAAAGTAAAADAPVQPDPRTADARSG